MTIQAIQTRYAGCYFRSRLEARWAVFFDYLEIEWQYEPEGFQIGCYCCTSVKCLDCSEHCNHINYLPDFYLPFTQTWVEVKGSEDALDRDLLTKAVDWGRGLPFTDDSWKTQRGLIVLGPIPRPSNDPKLHSIIQHRKGVYISRLIFTPAGFLVGRNDDWFGDGFVGHDFKGLILEPDEYWDIPWNPNNLSVREVNNAYAAARSERFGT